MITAKEIVDAFKVERMGQLDMFDTPERLLASTKFQKVSPKFDKESVAYWLMNIYKEQSTNYYQHQVQA